MMAKQITVVLSDREYQRAQEVARLRQQDMEELLAEVIKEGLDARAANGEQSDWAEHDPAVEREMAAYIALHPELKEKYFGKYVAIYHGALIDLDDDESALFERINEKYPDEFVWLTRVGPEPIETIVMRSPRLVRD